MSREGQKSGTDNEEDEKKSEEDEDEDDDGPDGGEMMPIPELGVPRV